MKNKHVESFGEFNENLNISDVSDSENIKFQEGNVNLEILNNEETTGIKLSRGMNSLYFETDKVNIQDIIDALRNTI